MATSPRRLDELPEGVLCDRARAGDSRAFGVLVRRYEVRMYRLALGIVGSPADAQDVAQDAFLRAWRRLPSFRGEATFATWLYRIVTNTALAYLRRASPSAVAGRGTDPVEAEHRGPQARAQDTALSDALARALRELPESLRVAWLLREVDGCGYEQVAVITGVRVSTARGRIARARRVLATALEGWR